MRIKEVEKATGLTAKAIRMYESKGLLTVARESENDYRDYSEDDVKRLKTIAVLRRLDIPVKEIKEWTDGQTELRDLIARASYEARTAEAEQKAKAELTGELLQILDEDGSADLPGAIEEADELQALYRELDEFVEQTNGALLWPIWWTIISLGPVGWTFIHILDGNVREGILSLVLSLVVVPLVCLNWFQYFRVEKKKRNTTGCLTAVIFGVGGIFLAIGSVVAVSVFQERIFSSGSGMYLFRNPWNCVALFFPVIELLLALNLYAEKGENKSKAGIGELVQRWLFVIGVNLVVYYCCIVSVSAYSEGTFTRHTVFNPAGHTYAVSDIDHVEAGFRGGWSTWLPWNEKGDFYYEITFTDGKTEIWTDLNAMGESVEEEDPWQLILELDKELMDAGVEKVSNWDNREHFQYDPSCLEIADQILNNQ